MRKFTNLTEEQMAYNVALGIIESCKSDKIGINEALLVALRDIYLVLHFSNDNAEKTLLETLAKEDVFMAQLKARENKIFKPEYIFIHSRAKKRYMEQLDCYIEAFKANAIREWESENSMVAVLKELVAKSPSIEGMEQFIEKLPEQLDNIKPEHAELIRELNTAQVKQPKSKKSKETK